MRNQHYYDMYGFGHNLIYRNDIENMPHKSAHWAIVKTGSDEWTCYSYATEVAAYNGGRFTVDGWTISATTRRHIRWFADWVTNQFYESYIPAKVIKAIDGRDGAWTEDDLFGERIVIDNCHRGGVYTGSITESGLIE